MLSPAQRRLALAISNLAYCNPFLPERIECERKVLGDRFTEYRVPWNVSSPDDPHHPNVEQVAAVSYRLACDLRDGRKSGSRRVSERDAALYQDTVLFALYHRYFHVMDMAALRSDDADKAGPRLAFWRAFAREYHDFFADVPHCGEIAGQAEHTVACFFQVRRAFTNIFGYLRGRSVPIANLRAAIWQSIFSHDMQRYRSVLYKAMGDLSTLITGPTGTGKELVARAIGLSRYIPFDGTRGRFTHGMASTFYPLNLSALSETLIESELFGHRKGAFTGAHSDRIGWLEECPDVGAVFLDELGDVNPAIQVKLLRVLQTREFQRLGETETRFFRGKVIAATHQDLASRMAAGQFRGDFFYRICGDQIRTPSLGEQLSASPDDLANLLQFICERLIGRCEEARTLAVEACEWIQSNLGAAYEWPGNFRELEQCVRSLIVRGSYEPMRVEAHDGSGCLPERIARGEATLDDVAAWYTQRIFRRSHNYEETARRLGVDRRTVKAKLGKLVED